MFFCRAKAWIKRVTDEPSRPADNLVAGQVGTVVEVLAPGIFEVEFLDASGRTVALTELRRSELLVLKHEANDAA
jgi:hypothetical protein